MIKKLNAFFSIVFSILYYLFDALYLLLLCTYMLVKLSDFFNFTNIKISTKSIFAVFVFPFLVSLW